MKPVTNAEFLNKDASIDTESAIEAGHDARTEAIRAVLKMAAQAGRSLGRSVVQTYWTLRANLAAH